MKPEQIIEALEAACSQLSIAVRYETMTGETSGAGGLCKVKGQWRVIIDRKLNTSDRAAVLVDALAQFDTDNVFLPPQVREAVNARRGGPPPKTATDEQLAHTSGQQPTEQSMPADQQAPTEACAGTEPAAAAQPSGEAAPAETVASDSEADAGNDESSPEDDSQ